MSTRSDKSLLERLLTNQYFPLEKRKNFLNIVSRCQIIQQKHGIYSNIEMKAAGFFYTGIDDTAQCHKCGLEVSNWTTDMKPYVIHSQYSPQCSYIKSILSKVKHTVETIKQCQFKEDRQQTIARARSLHIWQYTKPSRRLMFLAGMMIFSITGNILAQCMYCDAKYDNSNLNEDPFLFHQTWSPYCPYVLSLNPIDYDTDTSRKKTVDKLFTSDIISVETMQPVSDIVYPSESDYAMWTKRFNSFDDCPTEISMEKADALAKSGFYYTKEDNNIRCYYCLRIVNDFSRFSINEINSTHRSRFPHCRYVQLLPQPNEKQSNNSDNLCECCLKNPKNFVVYPCQHLSICLSCIQLTGACPRCDQIADAFYKLYI